MVVCLVTGKQSGAYVRRDPVPRPAPEFKIVEASGKTTMLSSYRGRVVLLAFISTQCAHCQKASLVFEQLSHEFAGRLQVAEAAFDEGADTAAFTKRFGLTFPVGVTTSDAAHAFLGVAAGARGNAAGGGDRPERE